MALPINIEDLLNKNRIESDRIEFKKGWNPKTVYHSILDDSFHLIDVVYFQFVH